jgi:hypothetical protein
LVVLLNYYFAWVVVVVGLVDREEDREQEEPNQKE